MNGSIIYCFRGRLVDSLKIRWIFRLSRLCELCDKLVIYCRTAIWTLIVLYLIVEDPFCHEHSEERLGKRCRQLLLKIRIIRRGIHLCALHVTNFTNHIEIHILEALVEIAMKFVNCGIHNKYVFLNYRKFIN